MDFDLQWLLIGLPVAFGLGWLASRFDLRQFRRDSRDAPRAYFKGLNLLLNEQQDKAIDAFIEAVQNDPDTTELHFALGNLFRRRGEFERAVRVHQHLLQRADLPATERDRAQHALAQDFIKAGLFDRAEQAFLALDGTPYQAEAQLALLTLYERSRDWQRAIDIAARIEATGGASLATRVAHYWCELAQAADDRGEAAAADRALQRARQAEPTAARALVMSGRRLARQGRPLEALVAWDELRRVRPASFALVAADYADAAAAAGRAAEARAALTELARHEPGIDLLRALARLQPDDPAAARERLLALLRQQPTLSAALDLLAGGPGTIDADTLPALRQALATAAKPLQRYRCAACGFEAQHWFWQCPGCLGWDSYPPRRIEEQ
ncbi:MAG: lipopolysaccharide assembly protein LapB [Rubrivivax sp.]|nr:lipopolysaccharide assembly protein LapB [Rubrivivax sp.]